MLVTVRVVHWTLVSVAATETTTRPSGSSTGEGEFVAALLLWTERTETGNPYRPTSASCLCISAAAVASLAAALDSLTRLSQCTADWAILVPR
jgi:hypothetical protein